MKNSKRIIGTATLIASLGLVAMPAMAAGANMHGCIKAGNQVRDVLNKNQHSPNYRDAKKMQRTGLQYCNTGLYKQGMNRYATALKLLGADKTADASQGDNS